MSEPIPVIVLSGILGAGKTTLLNHILTRAEDRDIAVVVNDMGDINVDAELVERSVEGVTGEDIVELSNGCICCSIQGELAESVISLAKHERFDYLLVEPSGISNPRDVVKRFLQGEVAGYYEVSSVVNVVDARQCFDAFETASKLDLADGDRPLVELMVEGVEFCDTVIVNKTDLVTDEQREALLETLQALQPAATYITSEFATVQLGEILDTSRFEPRTVDRASSWKQALDSGAESDGHDHPTNQFQEKFISFTYSSYWPFHPERLIETLSAVPESVLRIKGRIHVAGRPEFALDLSMAGKETHIEVSGRWIASLSASRQRVYRESRDLDWDDRWGDRKTELVVIGENLHIESVKNAFDEALWADEELNTEGIDNPLPDEDGERFRL